MLDFIRNPHGSIIAIERAATEELQCPVHDTADGGLVQEALQHDPCGIHNAAEDRGGGNDGAPICYEWNPDYLNGLIETDDDSVDADGSDVTWLVQDLADSDDDATGISSNAKALPERFEYAAYGTVDGSHVGDDVAKDGYSLKIGFQGGRIDSLTGLVHFGARDFDPTIGRWIEQDPTGAAYVNGANLYQFECGGPISNLDPTGTRIDIIYAFPDAPKKGATQPSTQPSDPNSIELEDDLKEYFKVVDNAIEVVKKMDNYETIRKAGNLRWDGKPVDISKAQYLDRLEREKTSKLTTVSDGGLDAFIKAIGAVAKNNANSWDDTAAIVHGELPLFPPGHIISGSHYGDGKNKVDLNGDDSWAQEDVKSGVEDSLKKVAGDYAFISCFDNPQKQEEIAQVNDYGLDEDVGATQPSNCYLDFITLRLTPQAAPSTQPTHPSSQPAK